MIFQFLKQMMMVFELKKNKSKRLFDGIEDIRLEIGFGMGSFYLKKHWLSKCWVCRLEVFENGVASLLAKIIKFRIYNIQSILEIV